MHFYLMYVFDYLSYINSLGFLFIFCFSLREGRMLETLDYAIPIVSTPGDLFIFRFVSLFCLRSTVRIHVIYWDNGKEEHGAAGYL